MRRTIPRPMAGLIAGLVALTALLPTAQVTDAADPTPAAPAAVRFEAGTRTGYKFTSTGAITASKAVTLARPSGASASRRHYVPGRGMYLAIANGLWAGYSVRESPVAYVIGLVGNTIYGPPQRIAFPAGTVVGYRFSSDWRLSSARVGTLGHASGADAARLAVINGVRYYEIVNGGWAGTWVPAVGPGTRALDCHTGPRAGGGMQSLRTIPNAGPEVALTFDMGGRVDPAMQIMHTLLLNGVCATIFPTGAMAQTPVGGQVLAFVKAYPQLFEVGNHTMHHCDLAAGGGGSPATAPCPASPPSVAFIQDELADAASIIAAGAGQQPIPYWRPPYGSVSTTVLNAAAGVGYTKTLLWDVDTIDWKEVADGGPTAEQIATKVATRAVNGSDVLMHLGGWNTANALPSMIQRLRARGMALSTISDLMDGR